MWIIVFLLNVYSVSATCLNGGGNHDGTCVCRVGYTGRHCQIKPYNSCVNVKDTVKQNLGTEAVVNGSPYPVCNGTNDNCYYRPGLPVSSKCLATFGSCTDHFSANHTATCDKGCTADAFQEDCCVEHAKCEAHVCAETIGQDTNKERLIYNTGTSGWVITHTEDGACKNDDWRFDKVVLYATIPEVVENCRTFIEFVGLGYACHQTKMWCTGTPMVCFYVKSAAAVHRSECEVGKLQGSGDNLFRLDWATSTATYDTSGAWGFHSLKTHTATDVTKFDTPEYFESLDSDGAECCSYTKMCEDYNSQCALPLKNVGSDISEVGEEASECCEPKTWRCDHSGHTCGTGFKVNTERCGLECATSFTTTLLGEYTGIPITSGSKNNCIGDEQGMTTSDECLEKCKGRDNYFIKNEICYCADGITSQCVADVGSACDCDIEHKTFSPDEPGYYLVSENTLTVCKSWTWGRQYCRDGWNYVDIPEDGSQYARQYRACVKGSYGNYYSGDCGTGVSTTCCDPIRYDTYRIDTTVTRTESLCCDSDTAVTLTACLSQACPDRYIGKNDYDTGFYTTNHTADCCDVIPESHYCWGITCESGSHAKRVFNTSYYCEGQCDNSQCCVSDDQYCDTFKCPDYYRKFNRTNITYQTVTEYFTTTGDCELIDTCVTSPNYPNKYSNNQACTITALVSGPLAVDGFATERCCDKLQVGGTAYGSGGTLYKGTSGPVDVSLAIGDKMFWKSDGSVSYPGWKVCLPETTNELIEELDLYCGAVGCAVSDCCAKNTEFCDSQTGNTGHISTGLNRCVGNCTYGDCWVVGGECDTDYKCGSGNVIDTGYRCNNMENGVCAQAEYSGTEGCCTIANECSTFDSYRSSYGAYNDDIGARVWTSLPGCESRIGYYIRYKHGAIPNSISWTNELFQNICCQYFQECEDNNVVGCPSGQYNLGDYSHTSSDHLYCWNQGTDDQDCTTEHQHICCRAETCETARTRTSNDKNVWTCVTPKPHFVYPPVGFDYVMVIEDDFRDKCCSLEPPLWGLESAPNGVVWGEKVAVRIPLLLYFWNGTTGAREFGEVGTGNIPALMTTSHAMYYNNDIMYTIEEIWDTTSSSWIRGGIVKSNPSETAFEVTNGDCVATAHYVSSPNFPSYHPNTVNCTFKALRDGKGMFSQISIGAGGELKFPERAVLPILNNTNAVPPTNGRASTLRGALLPYTEFERGDVFEFTSDGSGRSFGFQMIMVEEVFNVFSEAFDYSFVSYNSYNVKVMGDLVVYGSTVGVISISRLVRGGTGSIGTGNALISNRIDDGDWTSNARYFMDIQKSGNDYLVVVAHDKYGTSGSDAFVWFYKVTGSGASLIDNKRISIDIDFGSVVCSPDTTKCYAAAYYKEDTWERAYRLQRFEVDLAGSSVNQGGYVPLGYHCYYTQIAVSNTYVAYNCYNDKTRVYVREHTSLSSAYYEISADNHEMFKFSPDGKKLLLTFSSDQGSDQYMSVYDIDKKECLVGTDSVCTGTLAKN